jgi:hypothetical protein
LVEVAMHRRRTLLVTAVLIPLSWIATPANASGADMVAGHGSQSADGSVFFQFTVAAVDRTPGVGRDASGTLRWQEPTLGVDDTARVVCVSATGNTAWVIAETVRHRGSLTARWHMLEVTDGGPRGTDTVSGFSYVEGDLSDDTIAFLCGQAEFVGNPLTKGNITVRDGG